MLWCLSVALKRSPQKTTKGIAIPTMEDDSTFIRGIFFTLLFLAVLAVGAVLKVMAEVTLPIAIAVLLALVFHPIVETLHSKFKVPPIIGISIIFLFVFVIMFFLGGLLYSSAKTILSLYPKYEERLLTIYLGIADIFNFSYDEELSLISNIWGQLGIRSSIQKFAFSLSNTLLGFIKNLTVVALFVIFLITEMGLFKVKAMAALDGKRPGRISAIIKDIVSQVTRYISIKFFISLLTGMCVYVGTMLISLDFPIIWGFIAFVLNFIPNFGSIISGVVTTLFALIQFWPRPIPVILVALLILATNMILGNFIEPKIQGRNLGISPFIILVSLSVWGWLWGFLGMIVALPMMVILKIICENISYLYPISVMIGSKPPRKK